MNAHQPDQQRLAQPPKSLVLVGLRLSKWERLAKHLLGERRFAKHTDTRVDAIEGVAVHKNEAGGRMQPVHKLGDPDTLRAEFDNKSLAWYRRPIKQPDSAAKQLDRLLMSEVAGTTPVIYVRKDIRL